MRRLLCGDFISVTNCIQLVEEVRWKKCGNENADICIMSTEAKSDLPSVTGEAC